MKRSGFKNKPRKPLKRTPLSRGTSQMVRTPLKRVGTRGRANLAANKRLKTVLEDITECEVQYVVEALECLDTIYLTNAHRHKRAWYAGDVDLLSDRSQVIKACVNCHDMIEHDPELTEKVFQMLRGVEKAVEIV